MGHFFGYQTPSSESNIMTHVEPCKHATVVTQSKQTPLVYYTGRHDAVMKYVFTEIVNESLFPVLHVCTYVYVM